MKVGFTGTQQGMTDDQIEIVNLNIQMIRIENGPDEFHHGDCIGADAQAHDMAETLGYQTVSHPPVIEAKRAFKKATRTLEAKAYLDRNKDIVNACEILIAAPAEMTEQIRGGTWSTVRYAKKIGRPCLLVLPDGSIAGSNLG